MRDILAQDLRVGDVLVVPEGAYPVTQIDAWDLTNGKPVHPPYQQGGPGWPVLRILTSHRGYARFPHEPVTVDKGSSEGGAA